MQAKGEGWVVGMDTYLLRGPQELLPLRLHLMDDAVPCM